MDSSLLASHLKRHERAAIEKIDAAPVPACCLGGEIGARPFVVQPRGAADLLAVHRADGVGRRAAVVVARLLRPMVVAAEACFSLQDDAPRKEGQIKINLLTRKTGVIPPPLLLQPPVVEPAAGASLLGGEREPGA